MFDSGESNPVEVPPEPLPEQDEWNPERVRFPMVYVSASDDFIHKSSDLVIYATLALIRDNRDFDSILTPIYVHLFFIGIPRPSYESMHSLQS